LKGDNRGNIRDKELPASVQETNQFCRSNSKAANTACHDNKPNSERSNDAIPVTDGHASDDRSEQFQRLVYQVVEINRNQATR